MKETNKELWNFFEIKEEKKKQKWVAFQREWQQQNEDTFKLKWTEKAIENIKHVT